MILLLNSKKGYSDRNNTYRSIISSSKYPVQNTKYINKWCTLRCIYDSDRASTEGTTGSVVPNGLNNRFYINHTSYPLYTGTNLGHTCVFRIVRYDTTTPYRAILIDSDGGVVVTTVGKLLSSYDLYDTDGNAVDFVSKANSKVPSGQTLVTFNKTADQTTFFNSYDKEFIHKIAIQEDKLQYRSVYTEYDLDMTEDKSFNNSNMNIVNDWNWDADTLAEVKKVHPELRYMDESILKSFQQFYCLHGKSLVDNPKRTKKFGYIISADVNYKSAVVVEMDLLPSGKYKLRFITDQEARIYYNTESTDNTTNSVLSIVYNTATYDMGE